mgnify:CR=1 FL=1
MKTPDLKECREKLDGIDREIVRLFEERMAVCGQVAEYKIETGKAEACRSPGDGSGRPE